MNIKLGLLGFILISILIVSCKKAPKVEFDDVAIPNSGATANIDEHWKIVHSTEDHGSQNINDITQSSDGKVWIGTKNGLFIYNNDILVERVSEFDNKEIFKIYEDHLGVMWVASDSGGYYFNNGWTKYVSDFIDENEAVLAIYRTLYDDIFFSTEYRLLVEYANGAKKYYPYWNVRDIKEDSEGVVYFGSENGLYYYQKGWNVEKYFPRISDNKDINSIFINNENLVLFTTEDEGVARQYERFKDFFAGYIESSFTPDWAVLSSKYCDDILEMSNGKVWVATSEGVNVIPNKLSQSNPIKKWKPDNSVMEGRKGGLISKFTRCFMQDNSGRIWIGTREGISIFTP